MSRDAVSMTLLFDFYGDLLTEKQRTYFDLYYNQDFSLAEIAENEGISRQGVHDALTRAESILRNFEEKTLCVQKSAERKAAVKRILATAEKVAALPGGQALAEELIESCSAIKE